MTEIKTALISVWDKTNLVEFARFLINNNIKLISTGGTMKELEKNNIPVTSISSITGSKQMMDGRVKTLHPKIFGGILADRQNGNHMNDLNELSIDLIDLVVINLYPFKNEAVDKNLDIEKAIEYIDIGGPSMLRAAAKNFKYTIPICNINQYDSFIKLFKKSKGKISLEHRIKYAASIFTLTQEYDQLISDYIVDFSNEEISKKENSNFVLNLKKKEDLRYGENPHQSASLYIPVNEDKIWNQISGKKLSYNNYFDLETAVSIVSEFEDIACAIIKHANPCGFATGDNVLKAYKSAVSVDPVSYFGGIVAFNSLVDDVVANEMNKSFLECVIAPSFTKGAIEILKAKKNLRIISIDKMKISNNKLVVRSVFNSYLIQDKDNLSDDESSFQVVSKIKPTKYEFKSLILGWKLVKYVKSNAIVFSNDVQLLGVGAGQMSRIDSTKIAINKALDNNFDLKKSVMASDAFFPFPDCIQMASEYGVRGVIHPGGSIKDEEIIKEVNKLGMFMIFTNKRHFYH
ncbi:MAG: bifunctional phosphoribosylaminoimidazolecarboxamide formyltransferase/inosine monophosphate cyclohydrolase [Candidatus Marinimicrobia bacterium]|nr:bifunctional phosphoribosylaminoimidazolecarboxamide formyltransferase/inosine monophosphate cyclohydrolase [Candidatus Neomarinimicrobiota bacterium]|tara:strand:+ start:2862 stop:4415 length:1554 start_codon:yes stop_codon:yes gene_type:complete